jgi:hypothetical protein
MLLAGGHIDRHPLTLIAGLVHCEITTLSGTAALTAEENLIRERTNDGSQGCQP